MTAEATSTVVQSVDRAAALAEDDSSPGDSVLKLIQRFALKSFAW